MLFNVFRESQRKVTNYRKNYTITTIHRVRFSRKVAQSREWKTSGARLHLRTVRATVTIITNLHNTSSLRRKTHRCEGTVKGVRHGVNKRILRRDTSWDFSKIRTNDGKQRRQTSLSSSPTRWTILPSRELALYESLVKRYGRLSVALGRKAQGRYPSNGINKKFGEVECVEFVIFKVSFVYALILKDKLVIYEFPSFSPWNV